MNMHTHTHTLTSPAAVLDRATARELAQAEYRRLADLVVQLGGVDFTRPTDCVGWDVRAMLAHLLATMRANASMRENVRQLRAARRLAARDGMTMTDALTAVQIASQTGRSGTEIVEALAATWPKALRGRFAMPAPIRAVRIPTDTPAGAERWRLGYLVEVIYTRDVWMHRVDLSRALGRDVVLSAEHDGRLVADIVAEWGRRHGQAYELELTGPAGGTFSAGTGGQRLSLDAVEFCRTLSGRVTGAGLLACQVPF